MKALSAYPSPLVENNEFDSEGTGYFVKQHISRLLAAGRAIDTVILGCTHYPLLQPKTRSCLPNGIRLVSQGEIVAERLANYLDRHPETVACCSQEGRRDFYTTETAEAFDRLATVFYGREIRCCSVPRLVD